MRVDLQAKSNIYNAISGKDMNMNNSQEQEHNRLQQQH